MSVNPGGSRPLAPWECLPHKRSSLGLDTHRHLTGLGDVDSRALHVGRRPDRPTVRHAAPTTKGSEHDGLIAVHQNPVLQMSPQPTREHDLRHREAEHLGVPERLPLASTQVPRQSNATASLAITHYVAPRSSLVTRLCQAEHTSVPE